MAEINKPKKKRAPRGIFFFFFFKISPSTASASQGGSFVGMHMKPDGRFGTSFSSREKKGKGNKKTHQKNYKTSINPPGRHATWSNRLAGLGSGLLLCFITNVTSHHGVNDILALVTLRWMIIYMDSGIRL
jgi:hypothetical protein